MALEIERKFLVVGDAWRTECGEFYRQGYLGDGEVTVRVRCTSTACRLTIKSARSRLSRLEFEYEVPREDATVLLEMCRRPLIEKVRHQIVYQGIAWCVDEFVAANAGLVLAEVELQSEDQQIPLPEWVGNEVTFDPRYRNSSLVTTPMPAR